MVLAPVAAAVIGLHFIAVNNYGIFRDEFYYLGLRPASRVGLRRPSAGCGARWLASARWFGESLVAIRILPIALSGALVFLVAAIARRLGGGWFAQALAAVVVSLSPHFLFVFHILSMNSAEVVLWALGAWLILVAVQTGRAWPWLAFGVTAGVGLLTKHSMAVFGLGYLAGSARHACPTVAQDPVALGRWCRCRVAVRAAPLVAAHSRLADGGVCPQRARVQDRGTVDPVVSWRTGAHDESNHAAPMADGTLVAASRARRGRRTRDRRLRPGRRTGVHRATIETLLRNRGDADAVSGRERRAGTRNERSARVAIRGRGPARCRRSAHCADGAAAPACRALCGVCGGARGKADQPGAAGTWRTAAALRRHARVGGARAYHLAVSTRPCRPRNAPRPASGRRTTAKPARSSTSRRVTRCRA